jgi:hypothetical protein
MKLATEQHAEIANTFMPPIITCLKVLDVLCNENVTADVPNDIVDDIEKVRDALGATPSASRNSDSSILSRCKTSLRVTGLDGHSTRTVTPTGIA